MAIDFKFWTQVERTVLTGIRPSENKWLTDLEIIQRLWNTKDEAYFRSEGNRLIKEYERIEDGV